MRVPARSTRASARGVLALLLLVATACGPATISDPRGEAGKPGTESPDPQATSPRAFVDLQARAPVLTTTTLPVTLSELVAYRLRQPGDARTEALRVFPDGRVIYDDGKREVRYSVSDASVVEDLEAHLAAAGMEALPSATGAGEEVQHVLLYGGSAVRWAGDSPPEPLEPALGLLEAELRRGRQLP